jgi:hypothetical protein
MKFPTLRAIQIGGAALITVLTASCGGGGGASPSSNSTGTIQGTAAVGAALSNASITLACKSGNGAGTANANGQYSITFAFSGPCTLEATNGSTTLYSFASGSGVYNVSPYTELLLTYLSAELGTDMNGLLAGLASNSTYQSALTNSATVTAGENAIAQIVKAQYGLTLSTSAFLTTSFTVGQPGTDADIDALQAAGALSANNTPSSQLVNAVTTAGAAAGQQGSSPTGATGSSGSSI